MELSLTDREKQELVDEMMLRVSNIIRDEVREALDYHDDYFRLGWMRMMEVELNDLTSSNLDSACDHGQKVYAGIFHVIDQYLEHRIDTLMDHVGQHLSLRVA